MEECNEAFSMEDLLGLLPTNISLWIRDKKPTTVKRIGELADEYVRERNLDVSVLHRGRRWRPR